MKRIFLAVLALLALSALASAQAVDPAVQAAVEAAVPAQYAGYTSLALIALMMLGRWIKALQNGTGIKGWFSAIWFGTNTPKLLIASLCLLSLPRMGRGRLRGFPCRRGCRWASVCCGARRRRIPGC
jgi:uncharacterized protein involved in copper resistance